jgi:hypothetical protein
MIIQNYVRSQIIFHVRTQRTVRFQEDFSIPTVSIMQNHPQFTDTNVPFIHSVVLCTSTSSFHTLHSMRHSPTLMNAVDWRTAFPEPNLESFDNSIYVKVAIQAMTIDDVGQVFPSMSSEAYGDLQSTFQIDGGASLTAISEDKATALKCQFIPRKKFKVVVSVANGQHMTSDYYTPLKVTFQGIHQQTSEVKYKTVMIIANIVPVLSGGIIIGSDVMKALQVTIPYNDDNTAMLTVDGQSITFQYSNLAQEPIPKPFIRTMTVTKSNSRALSSLSPKHRTNAPTYSFNALFYGDHEEVYPATERPFIQPPPPPSYKRPIPVKLRASVQSEYDMAMQDPTKYMCAFNYQKPVSIPQLVALHCILNEYDIVVGRESNYLSRTGVQRNIPIIYAESTTASLE